MLPDWSYYLLSQVTPSRMGRVYAITSSARAYFFLLIDSLTKTSPSLTTVALLLIILLISLKILDMLWRAVLFWLNLATKILFWGGMAVMACWIYARGPEGVVQDIANFAGTWRGELGRAQEKAEYAKIFHKQMGGGARARREGQWNAGGRRW